MITILLLLAAFVSIVVVGATLVAVHDAAERLWTGSSVPLARPFGRPSAARRRSSRADRPRTPVVAWPHLH